MILPFKKPVRTKEAIEAEVQNELRFLDRMEEYITNRRSQFIQMENFLMDERSTVRGFESRYGRIL